MIVRRNLTGLRLFFVLRGSVLPRIALRLAITTTVAIVVTHTEGRVFSFKVSLTPVPFTLLGLALAIFLGFRNTASYERYWEGRRQWGDLLNVSRTFVRQVLSLVRADSGDGGERALQVRMAYRTIAFVRALRHQLRETDASPELRSLLPGPEWDALPGQRNACTFLLQRQGEELRQCLDRGLVSEWVVPALDASLTQMTAILGGCERIKATPLPFTYALLLHRTVYLYCFLLPFGLVDALGLMTPVMVALTAYTFFGLDALGDEIEEPFGMMPNDLPLHALDRNIEINIRQMLGESPLPPPIEPDDWNLL